MFWCFPKLSACCSLHKMRLREAILKEHSKANCIRIVKWVGDKQKRFDDLIKLFLSEDLIIVKRAGWPLSYIGIAHPELIQKHLGRLIKNLRKPNLHDAVKRNTVRLLQEAPIPEKYQGELMTICFDYIISPSEKPAIKAFSLTVLGNLSKQYPDIGQELKTIIEDRWDFESAAFKSRAKRVLKDL